MVARVGPKDFDVTIKFGGGLHTRASEDEIDPREAAGGRNFLLDLQNRELRRRPPFDFIAKVPNASEIRGGATRIAADGTVETLFQAGGTVYKWDGATGFSNVGSVNANAKLRGHWAAHNWTLDNKVLITDLAGVETVKEWDGVNLTTTAFTNQVSGSFGAFGARYLSVSNERAIFSNITDNGVPFPHMIVGSERGNHNKISVAQRPSSSLGAADPFFLLTPDLRPINGHVEAFGTTILSTERGRLFNLSGQDAKDFNFGEFYAGSAASGNESVVYIGNDVVYGRQGRVESVTDTNRFGDSEADDITAAISDQIEAYTGWRIVYNARLNRVYMFPEGVSEVWVFNTAMRGGQISPWMRWTTAHPLAFRPTFVMSMLDPADGLEYVFMGDASGNLFRMEGGGLGGDGGFADISMEWLTRLFSAPLNAEAFDIEGYIKYRRDMAATLTMRFEYAGKTVFNEAITLALLAATGTSYFGSNVHFGSNHHFGIPFRGRLVRQSFRPPGQASDLQLRIQIDGASSAGINEIGLRFRAASQ